MEAVYEFTIKDMPVTVAVDTKGESVHLTGPAHWKQQLAGINIVWIPEWLSATRP